jgi:hypothetical protein
MSRRTRRRFFAALGAVAAIAAAGFAIAYFTSGGSGSGTATVGTSTPFAITGSTTGTLYPGTSEPVTFTVNNPGGGNQQLGTISLSGIKACTNGATWDPTLNSGSGGCPGGSGEVGTCEDYSNTSSSSSANFSMANVVENQDLNGGTTYYGDGNTGTHPNQLTSGTGTLKMNDLASSQNQCKSVGLYLTFTS